MLITQEDKSSIRKRRLDSGQIDVISMVLFFSGGGCEADVFAGQKMRNYIFFVQNCKKK